jgi:organic hydroperoxide reductase OsmC/OhrA
MGHEYTATVVWRRDGATFTDNRYSREHVWSFDGGLEVPASSSPTIVPLPMSRPEAVDPEEAFVAALSSCHMLFFLSLAAKRDFMVDRYEDHAVGIMDKDARGKLFIARVTLDPKVDFSGDPQPSRDDIADLHHRAHDGCFIANSVRTEVTFANMSAHHA